MLFNSYTFLCIFLPVVVLGFSVRGARVRFGISWLFLCSLVFYTYWNPWHLPLLVGSILGNFWAGRHLARTGRGIGWAVAANLGLLAIFKYTGLVTSSLGSLVDDPKLVLPLAISFFTFQQVAYVVTCWRERHHDDDLLSYALFVSFFPQLIAGPIVQHKQFVEQLDQDWSVDARGWVGGAMLFTLGLFKKLVVADGFAPVADDFFASTDPPALAAAWTGTTAYALQIYFDFSGYSDMAMGLARLFGIELPVNFDAPYRATSIVDFWRRWHITLSSFLRDYLYIPLGGNRHGVARRWVNLFLTMLLGGLWHGASWTFMGWGALHGGMLAANHAWRTTVGPGRVPAPLGWGLTMGGVWLAWVLFRSEDLARSWVVWQGLAGANGLGVPSVETAAVGFGMLLCLTLPVSWRWMDREVAPRAWEATLVGVAGAVAVLHLTRVTPFLYFQF